MKKIVPFTKDIKFNNIYEINSISLEHNLSIKEDGIISGNFIVSGTYKMTSNSINVDEFSYNLPFEISIDKKYDTRNVTTDINDFYYEVIDNNILSIDIEVLIDNLEEIKENENMNENSEKIIDIEDDRNIDIETPLEEKTKETVSSIFENLDDNENYVTYKVHIITENDTTESIIQKYEITNEKLEMYNDLSELKIGDKLIIPTNDQN